MINQDAGERTGSFGPLFGGYRANADLTLRQLHKALLLAGYPVSALAMASWESGKRRPSNPAVIHYLAAILGLSEHEKQGLLLALLSDMTRDLLAAYERTTLEPDG